MPEESNPDKKAIQDEIDYANEMKDKGVSYA